MRVGCVKRFIHPPGAIPSGVIGLEQIHTQMNVSHCVVNIWYSAFDCLPVHCVVVVRRVDVRILTIEGPRERRALIGLSLGRFRSTYPGFPVKAVALSSFMQFFLKKAAYAVVATAAY